MAGVPRCSAQLFSDSPPRMGRRPVANRSKEGRLLVGGTVTPGHWHRDLKLSDWWYSEPWSRSQAECCMLTGKQLLVHEQ
jgi:hypothetical protein